MMHRTSKMQLLRQRGNVYLQLLRAKRRGLVQPVVADLFLTTRCNANCEYCYTDKSIGQDRELSTAQWKTIIDELHAAGGRMFNVMGGEPLLRADLPELLAHIGAKNALCDLNTNGFLLPQRLPELTHISQIFTSLDGRPASHDKNRGAGSYAKTMAGIDAAQRAGVPVRVNCTVTHHNINDIDYLIDLCAERNLFLTFTPLVRVRDSKAQASMLPERSDATTRAAFQAIKLAKRRTSRILNSDASLDYLIHYPLPLGQMVMRNATGPEASYYEQPCAYGRLQHFVVSNGDVYPCHNMWNDPGFVPKNALRDGVAEAVANASRLPCKFCWLANLVEWNEFTSLGWLAKGVGMTLRQLLKRRRA